MLARILRILAYALWVVLAAVGAWGLWLRFTTGHQLAAYGNYVPWGLWVVGYVYFSGMSAGFLVLSGYVAHSGNPHLAKYGPLALFAAAVTLFQGLLAIGMDLGHMNRAVEVMLHANFGSIMAWMIFLYSTDFTLVIIENALALMPDFERHEGEKGLRGFIARPMSKLARRIPEGLAHKILHRLGYIEIPLAVAFFGGVGALFGTISARGYWHHPLLPILFVAGAIMSAVGVMTVLAWALIPAQDSGLGDLYRLLGNALLALLLFLALLDFAEVSIELWQGLTKEADVYRILLFGPFWWNFWIVHMAFGTALPLFLLAFFRKHPNALAMAGLLAAFAFFSARIGQVIPPQEQPLLPGLADSFVSSRYSFFYFPNAFEWAVLAGVVAAGLALLWLGIKLLPVLPWREPWFRKSPEPEVPDEHIDDDAPIESSEETVIST
jgi:protein NrfD